jgi:single-strand DNA-binding protein
MSYDFNNVQLLGRCGAQPQVFRLEGKQPFAKLQVATNKRWKKDNTIHTRTDWHTVILNNKLADIAEKHLNKGDLVMITGELRTRRWKDSKGDDQYSTFVQAKELRFLMPKPKQEAKPTVTPSAEEPLLTDTSYEGEEVMDDIPF